MARLPNPTYDPGPPEVGIVFVKFVDRNDSNFGYYAVVFGLEIVSTPTCDTIFLPGVGEVPSGTTVRTLQVDLVQADAIDNTDEGWVDETNTANAFDLEVYEVQMERATQASFPLDWAPTFDY